MVAFEADGIKNKGRPVNLESQQATIHTDELFEAGHGTEEALKTWNYLSYGPWPSPETYHNTLHQQSASFDIILRAHVT